MNAIHSIKGFRFGKLILTLIDDTNVDMLHEYLLKIDESDYFINELHNSYMPKFDVQKRRIKYGFYTTIENTIVGFSLLGISSWEHFRGYTGADTILQMRGQNIAPLSKPPLFYLAFELLKLQRVEAGCVVSNVSSQKSIEKTKGFKFEGVLRDYCRRSDGSYEDELRYSIVINDWFKLYDKSSIEVIT